MAVSNGEHKYAAANGETGDGKTAWAGLNQQDRADFIQKYAPLIRYVADRLAIRLPPHVSKDDLVSAGILGLVDALDKFDPSRKIMFKTYAEFRVKGAMLDELRSMDWVPRSVRRKSSNLERTYHELEHQLGRPATDEEAASHMGLNMDQFHRLLDEVKSISLLDIDNFHGQTQKASHDHLFDFFSSGALSDPLSALNRSEAKDVLAQGIRALPEKEMLVVSMYYFDELTMKEIGEVLGYTESRISQLHTKALARLKGRLKAYFETMTGD